MTDNNTSRLRDQMAAALGFGLDALESWQAIKLDVAVSLKIELASLLTKQASGTEIDIQRMIAVGEALDRQLNPANEDSTRPVQFVVLPGESVDGVENVNPTDVQIADLRQQVETQAEEIKRLRGQLVEQAEPPLIEAPPAQLALPAPEAPPKPLLNQPVQAVSGDEAKARMARVNAIRPKPAEIDTRPNDPWRSFVEGSGLTWASHRNRQNNHRR
jgi:hypothetical protein